MKKIISILLISIFFLVLFTSAINAAPVGPPSGPNLWKRLGNNVMLMVDNWVLNINDLIVRGTATIENLIVNNDAIIGGTASTTDIRTNQVLFNTGLDSPAYQEALLFYDDNNKTLGFYNDESDSTLQIGQEVWVRGKNVTGDIITNGQVIYISGDDGTNLEFSLAQSNSQDTALPTLAFATHDIEPGTIGIGTRIGTIRDINTSGFASGALIWLDAETPGAVTTTEPFSPNYSIFLGKAGIIDAANGTFEAHISPGTNIRSTIKFFDGAILENHVFNVSSDGSIVTATLEKDGTGDLNLYFNGEFTAFDTTPAASVALTTGSDSSPTLNYIFIPETTNTLTANTTGFPSGQHVPVGTVLVPTAITAQASGLYKVHAWTDHLVNGDDQGHLSHLNAWIRTQPATWRSGVITTVDIQSVASPDDVFIDTTTGTILQLHNHLFPAFDLETDSEVKIPNDFTSAFATTTNLNTILTDALGVSMNNNYFHLILWGSVSEDAGDSQEFINVPTCSYGNITAATADSSKCSVFDIPTDFIGTGFLISDFLFKHGAGGGGTWTLESQTDLRGLFPSVSAGGAGTGGGETTFADNQFAIFNAADNTKILNWNILNVTTGNTRTLTMADRDLDLADPTFDSATTTGHLFAGTYASSTLGFFTQGDLHIGGDATIEGTLTLDTGITDVLKATAGVVSEVGSPVKNYALLWNGTTAVWAAQGTSFTFSIASFVDNQSNTQEIGTGTFLAIGATTFTASYNNGPATSGSVQIVSGVSAWASALDMGGPNYTGPTASVEAVPYPASPGTAIRFRLTATDGVDPDTSDVTITLNNLRFWGVTSKTSGYTEADVEGLAGSELSNSKDKSFSSTTGSGEYVLWASRTALGTVSFTVGGFEGGFQSPETVSITNSSGFTEDYYVYRSTNSNLGTITVVAD